MLGFTFCLELDNLRWVRSSWSLSSLLCHKLQGPHFFLGTSLFMRVYRSLQHMLSVPHQVSSTAHSSWPWCYSLILTFLLKSVGATLPGDASEIMSSPRPPAANSWLTWGVQKPAPFLQDGTDSGATQPPELSTGLHWGQTEAPEATTSLSSYPLCFILPPELSFFQVSPENSLTTCTRSPFTGSASRNRTQIHSKA